MDALAPLRISVFRRLWFTSVIFGVGHTMQVVAANWLMLELTSSPTWVALMVASPHLPLLLLAVPSGAMADTFDRRRVLALAAGAMGASALAMAWLYESDRLTPGRLLLLGILVGIGVALYVPAWQALVPSLVPRELIPRAVGLNSASGAVAMAIGPALGGALVAAYGLGVPAAVAALGYLTLLVSVLGVTRVPWQEGPRAPIGAAMALGLRYVRFSAGYRWLLLVAAMFGASSAALRAMLPSITSDRLLAGASVYGVLLGAMGIGAVVGALFREQAVAALGRRLIPVAIGAYGIVGIVVAASPSLWLTSIAIAIGGAAWTWTLTTLNSTVQLLTPAWVRARALSIYLLALFGLVPLGTAAAGVLGEVVGAPTALAVSSVAVVVLALAVARRPVVEAADLPPPDAVGARPTDGHPTIRSDQRVMVTTVWTVDQHRLDEFVDVMEQLRRIRLRTGAFRWTLYRDVVQPTRFTEVFEVPTWDEHLLQHERLDAQALAVLEHAVGLDAVEGPRSVHLVGVDRTTLLAPDWSSVDLTQHGELHRRDGSITVRRAGTPRVLDPSASRGHRCTQPPSTGMT